MKRAKRAPKKVPRNGARRANAPKLPLTVERWFAGALASIARTYSGLVRKIVVPRLKEFARPEVEERTDAKESKNASKAKEIAKEVQSAADRSFSASALRSLSQQAARRIDAHSKDQFKKLSIDTKKEPVLKWLVNGWIKDIASRVQGMTEEQTAKLEKILAEGERRHVTSIAKDIEEQLGVTENRADFIARDSVLTLNSKITRERMSVANIAYYVWTSMQDDRVRPRHEELDGQVFEVDGDGDSEEGHPGEPPNCRCVQWPLPADANEESKDEET